MTGPTPARWVLVAGARLVNRTEYRAVRRVDPGLPATLVGILTEALAAAADADGLIHDLEFPAFYRRHVQDTLCLPDAVHPDFQQLTYDAFTAVVLIESLNRLITAGLLAQSSVGDDYHLALPGGEREVRG